MAEDLTSTHNLRLVEAAAGPELEEHQNPASAHAVTLAEQGSTSRLRWIRRVGVLALALVLLGGGGYAAYTWSQQQWFVGQANGHVAIFRGVPQRVGSLNLAHVSLETGISTADLPGFYLAKVAGHIRASSEADARRTVLDLSGQALRCQQIRRTGGTCGTGS